MLRLPIKINNHNNSNEKNDPENHRLKFVCRGHCRRAQRTAQRTTMPSPIPPPAGRSNLRRRTTNAARQKAKKHDRSTFNGKLTAVDTNAMTLTVGKRTFEITSETIITKAGKPATLADGVAGETASGAYKKGADGKLTATSIHLAQKPKAKRRRKRRQTRTARAAAPTACPIKGGISVTINGGRQRPPFSFH